MKVLKCEKYIEGMQDKQAMFEVCDAIPNLCLKELIGFGVPRKPIGQHSKEINVFMQGPHFFYYENDAFASKDIWKTISKQFNSVEPELVDSMFFSASRRARGYVHNLLIEEWFQVEVLPP